VSATLTTRANPQVPTSCGPTAVPGSCTLVGGQARPMQVVKISSPGMAAIGYYVGWDLTGNSGFRADGQMHRRPYADGVFANGVYWFRRGSATLSAGSDHDYAVRWDQATGKWIWRLNGTALQTTTPLPTVTANFTGLASFGSEASYEYGYQYGGPIGIGQQYAYAPQWYELTPNAHWNALSANTSYESEPHASAAYPSGYRCGLNELGGSGGFPFAIEAWGSC
jgi:hypothetical protein